MRGKRLITEKGRERLLRHYGTNAAINDGKPDQEQRLDGMRSLLRAVEVSDDEMLEAVRAASDFLKVRA